MRLSGIGKPNYRDFFSSKSWIARWLYRGLLWTGNPRPNVEIFDSCDTFLSYLASREFRAAIAICDPQIVIGENGEPKLDYRELAVDTLVGFTPWPIPLPSGYALRRYCPDWSYGKGEGKKADVTARFENGRDFIVADCKVKFRLGEKARQLVEKRTHDLVPWFWTQIRYVLDIPRNRVMVRVEGSAFPHHWSYYRYGKQRSQIHDHNMYDVTPTDIRNIFEPEGPVAERGFVSKGYWVEL